MHINMEIYGYRVSSIFVVLQAEQKKSKTGLTLCEAATGHQKETEGNRTYPNGIL